MKRIRRLDLSKKTLDLLAKRTSRVAMATDPNAEVDRLWKQKDNQAFEEIRAKLGEMATGLERCMYCEDSEGTDIEHFRPKSHYPQTAFAWSNYLLACSVCNSNHKRDQFPLEDGEPLLIDPTSEEPLDHLILSSTGKFSVRTAKGKTSIEVFGLERPNLVKGRGHAWTRLEELIVGYAARKRSGDLQRAELLETAIRKYPFASVFVFLLRAARHPDAELLVDHLFLDALRQCPEVESWV